MIEISCKNVICPWQSATDLKTQAKFLDRLLLRLDKEARDELLGLNKPDRVWRAKDDGKIWCHETNTFIDEVQK